MPKFLIALIALSATLAFTGSASAATTTTVQARTLGTVRLADGRASYWVARADAKTIAWGEYAVGARANTVTDAGTVRSLPAQPGCTPASASAGHVGYFCGDTDRSGPTVALSARVTSLTGIVQSDVRALVPAPPFQYFGRQYFVNNYGLTGIGTRWLHFVQYCETACDTNWTENVDWRTGESHQIATLDPALHEDLDARSLTVPLCSPLRSDHADAMRGGAATAVILARPWALLAGPPAPGGVATWTVRRCGSAVPVDVPAGSDPVGLGGGWLLLEDYAKGTIKALRLADRRMVTIAGVPPTLSTTIGVTALTSRRVLFSAGDGAGTDAVLTARLPKK